MAKNIKLYFCPNCRSKDVGFKQSITNLLGIIPMMKCNECGHKSGIFPQLIVDKKKLLEKELKDIEKDLKEDAKSEKIVGSIIKDKKIKKDILDDISFKKKTKKKVRKK